MPSNAQLRFAIDQFFAAIPGHWEKVIATILLILVGVLLSRLWARYLVRTEISADKRLMHLVWARNVIWSIVSFILFAVWASTIAGFALSLAGSSQFFRQFRPLNVVDNCARNGWGSTTRCLNVAECGCSRTRHTQRPGP